jgi:hypothetical protein
MSTVKTKSIPTGNSPFMVWLANYLSQIAAFIAGPNAPDGFPYFSARGSNRFTTVVTPAITTLQGQWTPVSVHGTHTAVQTKAFEDAKKLFLKNTLRPWNKENVLYNSAFTVTNRGNIGVLPVVSTERSAAGLTTEQVFAAFKSLGACNYEISCKQQHDAKHAACPEGKIVQMCYIAVPRVAAGAVQPAPPSSVAATALQMVSSHALFHFDFGAANAGQILYAFFRWFDLKHPEKSGPWSILYTINLA